MDRPRGDSGETLLESLVSLTIIGAVLLVLIGAVTLSGSLTTILKAQTISNTAGRSVYEAVSGYEVPKGTPLVVSGACNTSVTNQLLTVAQDAAAASPNVTLNTSGITFGLVVLSVNSSGAQVQTVYPCGALAGHPIASQGEAAVAIEVGLPVTATGTLSVDRGDGTVERREVSFPSTLRALVFQGIA